MAQFVRDKDSFTDSDQPDKQKMSVRFYHNAFEDPDILWSKTVILSKALPKPLVKYTDIVKYIKRGQLWVVNLDYVKDQVEAIGLYDKLECSSPGKKGVSKSFVASFRPRASKFVCMPTTMDISRHSIG